MHNISIEKAKQNKLFYFVANVVIFRESDGRCLLLKRDMREKVHPGKYAVPGGKLEWEDMKEPTRINGIVKDFENAVEDLLRRETFEEAGIEIEDDFRYINSVAFIRPDLVPVVLVKFAAKYKSGEIKLEEGAFTNHVWANSEEALQYPCIDGVPEEVRKTIELFSEKK